MSDQNIEELLKREEEFHDDWADNENIDEIDPVAFFESMASFENKYIIEKMGDLKGKKILDVGAGLGESSVYFAMKGAIVYYNDISPKMGEFAKKLADLHNVELQYLIQPVEKLEMHKNEFDFIHCANLMHHVPIEDHDFWIKSMYESLKDDGALFTWDPLKYNPVINIYRRMAMDVRTIDEMPLGFDILKKYKKYFTKVEHKENWFLTNLIFIYYFLIKRYSPNKVRYWKQIYKEDEKSIGWWFKPLAALDKLLMKIPLLNYMAWTITIYAKK